MRGDVPGKELIYAVDGVVGDTLEKVFQVRLGIESTKLGCTDQRIHAGRPLSAPVGPHEEKILST